MERQLNGLDDCIPVDSDFDSQDSLGEEEEEEDEAQELMRRSCLVCVKLFSTEAALEAHLKTKKHKAKSKLFFEEQRESDYPLADAGNFRLFPWRYM